MPKWQPAGHVRPASLFDPARKFGYFESSVLRNVPPSGPRLVVFTAIWPSLQIIWPSLAYWNTHKSVFKFVAIMKAIASSILSPNVSPNLSSSDVALLVQYNIARITVLNASNVSHINFPCSKKWVLLFAATCSQKRDYRVHTKLHTRGTCTRSCTGWKNANEGLINHSILNYLVLFTNLSNTFLHFLCKRLHSAPQLFAFKRLRMNWICFSSMKKKQMRDS